MLHLHQQNEIRTVLRDEGVIAYPTEGVWGLGCLPASHAAVMRLLELKQRSWRQGLLIVAGRIDQFDEFLQGLGDDHRRELEENWPGPVTYLVPVSIRLLGSE